MAKLLAFLRATYRRFVSFLDDDGPDDDESHAWRSIK